MPTRTLGEAARCAEENSNDQPAAREIEIDRSQPGALLIPSGAHPHSPRIFSVVLDGFMKQTTNVPLVLGSRRPGLVPRKGRHGPSIVEVTTVVARFGRSVAAKEQLGRSSQILYAQAIEPLHGRAWVLGEGTASHVASFPLKSGVLL